MCIRDSIYDELDKASVETSKAINQASDKINELAKEAKLTADETVEDVYKRQWQAMTQGQFLLQTGSYF